MIKIGDQVCVKRTGQSIGQSAFVDDIDGDLISVRWLENGVNHYRIVRSSGVKVYKKRRPVWRSSGFSILLVLLLMILSFICVAKYNLGQVKYFHFFLFYYFL
jgi:hypothetical protein